MNKSEKFWDKLSKDYDKQAKNDKAFEKNLRITKKHLKPSDIVLDYACATGLYSFEIAEDVKEIQGIDISSRMIEAANRIADERKIENIDFEKGTLFDERFKSESFDAIMALNIIHLVEDSQKVMQRINELLKPGGLIISSTPCLGEKKTFLSYFSSMAIFLLVKIRILPPLRFFNIPALEDLISKRNFQIVETEILTYNPATEYFIVAKKII